MKKILFLLFLGLPFGLFADGIQNFDLDLKKDIILGAGGLTLGATGYIMRQNMDIYSSKYGWIDEDVTFSYNPTLDSVSDVLSLSPLIALPFLLDSFNTNSVLTLGVLYAETALFSIGLKDVLKTVIQRPRPYNFLDSVPLDKLEDNDRYFGFPSGHTTISFMTAGFSTYIFSTGSMDKKYKILMGISTFGLATSTGILRVTSGNHYVLDVVSGAIIGTGIGILIPFLHRSLPENMGIYIDGKTLGLTLSI